MFWNIIGDGAKISFPSYHYMACHAVIVNGADQPD